MPFDKIDIESITKERRRSVAKSGGGTTQTAVIEAERRERERGIDLAPLRIYSRHDVLDGSIFAGRIHRLEDQKHSPSVPGRKACPAIRSRPLVR